MMRSVEEAQRLVLEQTRTLPACRVPLADALGRVLAEPAVSDIDSPPYDKALMDGFAVVAADIQAGTRELRIREQVTAGCVPQLDVRSGEATQIMTGAPLPRGADAVVMVERTSVSSQDDGTSRVRIEDPEVSSGQNIMRKATSLRQGEQILAAGRRLRATEIGVLAEIGYGQVMVYPPPRVAVLSTGDELVDAAQPPAPGQIRNSNGPLLAASVRGLGGDAVDLGIAQDDESELRDRLRQGLEHDVLVLSGGVSAGVLDLVPKVLRELGVREVFHKVNVKPGKPVWFGVRDQGETRTLVFGLPGNPVSSLVCFQLFVRPALATLAGRPGEGLPGVQAVLRTEHRQRGDRPTYFPSRLSCEDGIYHVQTLAWQGSADQRTLVDADSLTLFPAGDRHFAEGERVTVYRLD